MSDKWKYKNADGQAAETAEWYINPKARCRRMMANELDAEQRRVYACLELGSMAYRQELCIKSPANPETGKPEILLTRKHIAESTGLPARKVRVALKSLEAHGLIERRPTDNSRPGLRKGEIAIFCFAIPREPGAGPDEIWGTRAGPPFRFPDWFPESWEPVKTYIKRNKIKNLPDELPADLEGSAREPFFSEMLEDVRAAQKIEKKIARNLKRLCAQPPHKEERKERNFKETKPPASEQLSTEQEQPDDARPHARGLVQTTNNNNNKPPETPAPVADDPLKSQIRQHLTSRFDLPTAPTDDVIDQIAAHLRDGPGLEQFKKATEHTKPRTWKVFVTIAKQCAAHRPAYEQAAAAAVPRKPIDYAELDARARRDREARKRQWNR